MLIFKEGRSLMKYKLIPDTDLMLDTISKSVRVTEEEMLNALVWAAYNKPHAEWDSILQAFRKRERGGDRP